MASNTEIGDPANDSTPTATTSSQPLESGRDAESALDIPTKESSNTIKISEPLDEKNWSVWKERMKLALRLCGLEGYADGSIKCPDDPVKAKYWAYNDSRAQFIIVNNISSSEMVNTTQCSTTHKMWLSLEAVHEEKSHHTIVMNIHNLLHTSADENTNISDHLTTLKTYWERINLISNDDFKLPDMYFKVIISLSLPASWDTFTETFVGGQKGQEEKDPRKLLSSQEFIGTIKEEYARRLTRMPHETINQATSQAIAKPSLAKRIGAPMYTGTKSQTPGKMFCRQCKRRNHYTADCMYLSMEKCKECGRFGHLTKHCWNKQALLRTHV